MSIDWTIYLREPFSVSALVHEAGRVAEEILGHPVEGVSLQIRTVRPGLAGRLDAEHPVDDRMVVSTRSDLFFDVASSRGDDAVEVQVHSDEQEEGEPESGTWMTVTAFRTDLSVVLAASTAIAAARLTGNSIVDDLGFLGTRLADPDTATVRITAGTSGPISERVKRTVVLMNENAAAARDQNGRRCSPN